MDELYNNHYQVKLDADYYEAEANRIAAGKVIKELQGKSGTRVIHIGSARSFDGQYTTNEIVEVDAFCKACAMLMETREQLSRTRAELERERAKKWWQVLFR